MVQTFVEIIIRKKQAWKTFFTAKDLNEKLGEKSHQIVKQNAIDSFWKLHPLKKTHFAIVSSILLKGFWIYFSKAIF
jgi:hypothetical protein